MANALSIQELVEQCIEFLRDSVSDLQACALVSPSWTPAAQALIFKEVSTKPGSSQRSWARLHQTLYTSPHLIRYIHRLRLDSHALSDETFSAICEFPFTHLHYASLVYGGDMSLPVGLSIQQLLSLPAIKRVKLATSFTDPSIFLRIWDRCSSSLTHMELFCVQTSTQAMPPILQRFAGRVALESFSIVGVLNLMAWLMHDLCPLDVSHLKTLSTGMGMEADELLRSHKFAPALRTIEALDTFSQAGAIDLSALPNLVLIRMLVQSTSWQSALDTLSTLPASSHVRKIVILATVDTIPSFCAQLDSKVISLAVRPLPVLELETPSQAGASMESLDEYFPQLASRNLVRCRLSSPAGNTLIDFVAPPCRSRQKLVRGKLCTAYKLTRPY
ncbi:hypothetical protein FB451DRAFT_1266540 [Mycena latifolia]|nr:hypothetical protein FB451DRAFT_1266540 [Mycena latifolia]